MVFPENVVKPSGLISKNVLRRVMLLPMCATTYNLNNLLEGLFFYEVLDIKELKRCSNSREEIELTFSNTHSRKDF